MEASRVLCIVGDELPCRLKLQWYKEQFQKKYEDAPIEELDMDVVQVGEIRGILQGGSLFDPKRMYILRNVPVRAQEKKSIYGEVEAMLTEVLPTLTDDSVVVLFSPGADKRKALFKQLKKNDCVIQCTMPTGTALLQWMVEYSGKKVSTDVARAIVAMLGEDQEACKQAVDKVIAYAGSDEVNTAMVPLVLEKVDAPNIFQLLDALSEQKVQRAMHELDTLEQHGEDLFMIHAMLMRQVRLLYYYATVSNKSELQTVLKLHPFVEKKTASQAKKLSAKILGEAYKKLLSIDQSMKNGKIRYSTDDTRELRCVLDQFIVDVCGII